MADQRPAHPSADDTTSPLLPAPVYDLLCGAFPGAVIGAPTATKGGFSHLSAALLVGQQACVLKAADRPLKRGDLRHEAALLSALARRLPVPALVGLYESPDWTVLLTAQAPGAPGLLLYERPTALPAALRTLGQTLRRLHRLTPDQVTGIALPQQATRATTTAAALADLPLAPALQSALAQALAHPLWHTTAPRLTHGDAGLHNLLWAPHRPLLLDWELGGWGAPALDAAWVAWTLRFRRADPTLWAAFCAGYGATQAAALTADAAGLHALALGQVAALLWRAHGNPASWAEWQRRALWTLDAEARH